MNRKSAERKQKSNERGENIRELHYQRICTTNTFSNPASSVKYFTHTLSLSLSLTHSLLTLVLKLKIKVRRVKLMHANVTVLTTTGVSAAARVESESIDGAKVSLDTPQLLLKDHVEEACIEFAGLAVCRGHGHGLLTTTQHNMLLHN